MNFDVLAIIEILTHYDCVEYLDFRYQTWAHRLHVSANGNSYSFSRKDDRIELTGGDADGCMYGFERTFTSLPQLTEYVVKEFLSPAGQLAWKQSHPY